MVESSALNCGPLRPVITRTKLSFGSDNNPQPEEEYTEDAGNDSFDKKAGYDCEGADCSASQANTGQTEKSKPVRLAGKLYEGFVSPIKTLIENPALLGATVAGGFAIKALVDKFSKVGVLALTATSGIAAFNIGKGTFIAATAENDSEQEKGMYNIGQGLSYGVMAVLPAKPVAIKAEVPGVTAQTNSFEALGRCIWESPKIVYNIVKALGNKGEGLASALGATTVTTGTELSTSSDSGIDPSDLVGGGDGTDTSNLDPADKAALDGVLEGTPEGVRRTVETLGGMSRDPSSAAALAAQGGNDKE